MQQEIGLNSGALIRIKVVHVLNGTAGHIERAHQHNSITPTAGHQGLPKKVTGDVWNNSSFSSNVTDPEKPICSGPDLSDEPDIRQTRFK